MNPPVQLIVGLGNPGPRYKQTRHNVGFWFIDELAKRYGIKLQPEAKFHGLIGKLVIGDRHCWLLLPATYMNLSGKAIYALARFYKIAPESILVAHDELDFPPGIVRLKRAGGHGGHNGLRSTINYLHSKEFYRLRIGIGHPGDKNAVVEYVTNKPSKNEKQQILTAIERGVEVIPDVLRGDFDKAMQHLHGG